MDPLAQIVHRESAYRVGKALAGKLREVIPRQQFRIPIQAAIGVKVVASENLAGKCGLCKCESEQWTSSDQIGIAAVREAVLCHLYPLGSFWL